MPKNEAWDRVGGGRVTGTSEPHILSEISRSSTSSQQIPTPACLPKNGPFGRGSKPCTRVSRAPKISPLLARGYGALTIASNRSALTTLSVICRSRHSLAPLVFTVSSVVALVPAWLRAHVNARTCRFSLRFTRWHWPPITRGAAMLWWVITDSDHKPGVGCQRPQEESDKLYLAPTALSRVRLLQGRRGGHQRIFVTGFPLPSEENLATVREDLARRLD